MDRWYSSFPYWLCYYRCCAESGDPVEYFKCRLVRSFVCKQFWFAFLLRIYFLFCIGSCAHLVRFALCKTKSVALFTFRFVELCIYAHWFFYLCYNHDTCKCQPRH